MLLRRHQSWAENSSLCLVFRRTCWRQIEAGFGGIFCSKQTINNRTTAAAGSSLLSRRLLDNWRILTSHQAGLIIINPPIRLTIKGAIWLVNVCPQWRDAHKQIHQLWQRVSVNIWRQVFWLWVHPSRPWRHLRVLHVELTFLALASSLF